MRRDDEPGRFVVVVVMGIALVSGIAAAIVACFSAPKQEKQAVRR